MKTLEELKALKEEFKTLTVKLAELSEEELSEVTGGSAKEPTQPEGCSWGASWQ